MSNTRLWMSISLKKLEKINFYNRLLNQMAGKKEISSRGTSQQNIDQDETQGKAIRQRMVDKDTQQWAIKIGRIMERETRKGASSWLTL